MRRGGKMVAPAQPRSYYGPAVIATPVWRPEVPWYFFVGGMAGAAAPLAAGARLAGNVPLARHAAAIALAGSAISPVLLIADLGRPERFHRPAIVLRGAVACLTVMVFTLATPGPNLTATRIYGAITFLTTTASGTPEIRKITWAIL